MIYLDHNATSPLLDEALEAMKPWLGVPANPASVHRAGQAAAVAVDAAREQVAALLGGDPAGVVFTSGATEANHMGLRGLHQLRGAGTLALSALEHPCVRAAASELEGLGWRLLNLPVDTSGRCAIDSATDVLVVMAANHETGVLQPMPATAPQWLHVDATQAAGRVDLTGLRADAIALSSHKLGGPGGVGALVLRSGDPFPPLLSGGAQERGRRAGSVNVAGVVGFGAACALALSECAARQVRWRRQIAGLESALVAAGGRIAGAGAPRVGNTVCAVFDGLLGETLVQLLDLRGLCASSGAACASGSLEASPVLLAMGDPSPRGGLRLSLGPRTTDAEVDQAAGIVAAVVSALRF